MSSAAVNLTSARPETPRRQLGNGEFVALMAMLQALQALAIDSMLPALGKVAHDLGVSDPNQRQYVIAAYFLFAGLGALIPGTLADRFGRRPVLLFALVCYVLGNLVCAVAGSFAVLVAARGLIGITTAGLTVLPIAIIRDRFSGDRMARLQSMVSTVFMVVPMVAPSLGQGVLLIASWRWIFGGMALMGTLLTVWTAIRLPETLRPEHRTAIAPRATVATLWRVIAMRAAFGYTFGMALIQGALFGYINSAQQLVVEHFRAGRWFPLLFAGMAASLAVANFTNSRIVERFGARRVSQTALIVYIVASAGQLAQAMSGVETLWRFLPVMTLNMMMMGFIGANFGSIALQPFAKVAGAAASAQAFIRMLLAALVGAAVGQAYDGSARPLALAMLGAGVAAMALVLFSERGRLVRRLIPPGGPRPVG